MHFGKDNAFFPEQSAEIFLASVSFHSYPERLNFLIGIALKLNCEQTQLMIALVEILVFWDKVVSSMLTPVHTHNAPLWMHTTTDHSQCFFFLPNLLTTTAQYGQLGTFPLRAGAHR